MGAACKAHAELHISTWNCRGLNCSEAYLKHQSDIILLQEHWLWPFELQKLSSVINSFSAFGVSDLRLCESSTLRRGCGGVATLRRKSLSVTPVTLSVSDRAAPNEWSRQESRRFQRVCSLTPSFNDCICDLEEEINRVYSNTTAGCHCRRLQRPS